MIPVSTTSYFSRFTPATAAALSLSVISDVNEGRFERMEQRLELANLIWNMSTATLTLQHLATGVALSYPGLINSEKLSEAFLRLRERKMGEAALDHPISLLDLSEPTWGSSLWGQVQRESFFIKGMGLVFAVTLRSREGLNPVQISNVTLLLKGMAKDPQLFNTLEDASAREVLAARSIFDFSRRTGATLTEIAAMADSMTAEASKSPG